MGELLCSRSNTFGRLARLTDFLCLKTMPSHHPYKLSATCYNREENFKPLLSFKYLHKNHTLVYKFFSKTAEANTQVSNNRKMAWPPECPQPNCREEAHGNRRRRPPQHAARRPHFLVGPALMAFLLSQQPQLPTPNHLGQPAPTQQPLQAWNQQWSYPFQMFHDQQQLNQGQLPQNPYIPPELQLQQPPQQQPWQQPRQSVNPRRQHQRQPEPQQPRQEPQGSNPGQMSTAEIRAQIRITHRNLARCRNELARRRRNPFWSGTQAQPQSQPQPGPQPGPQPQPRHQDRSQPAGRHTRTANRGGRTEDEIRTELRQCRAELARRMTQMNSCREELERRRPRSTTAAAAAAPSAQAARQPQPRCTPCGNRSRTAPSCRPRNSSQAEVTPPRGQQPPSYREATNGPAPTSDDQQRSTATCRPNTTTETPAPRSQQPPCTCNPAARNAEPSRPRTVSTDSFARCNGPTTTPNNTQQPPSNRGSSGTSTSNQIEIEILLPSDSSTPATVQSIRIPPAAETTEQNRTRPLRAVRRASPRTATTTASTNTDRPPQRPANTQGASQFWIDFTSETDSTLEEYISMGRTASREIIRRADAPLDTIPDRQRPSAAEVEQARERLRDTDGGAVVTAATATPAAAAEGTTQPGQFLTEIKQEPPSPPPSETVEGEAAAEPTQSGSFSPQYTPTISRRSSYSPPPTRADHKKWE